MTMMPPTIASLRTIDRFSTASDALEAAREITQVPMVLPKVVQADGAFRIVLPGDDDYDGPVGVIDSAGTHGDWMKFVDSSRVTGFSGN